MEYFDFGSYGFLAALIGANFFPSRDPAAQLLSALAVFGVSFFFRPLGGIIFGYLGDKAGRKISLISSIILMSVSTALIGVLPTYAAIGTWAPVLLVTLRAIEGLSLGGEYSGAAALIVEHAPPHRRGLWTSFMSVTSAMGIVVGSSLVLVMTAVLHDTEMAAWGWRIPFLIAIPLGVVGLYMRLRLEESPVFEELRRTKKVARNPFASFSFTDGKNILITIAFASAAGLSFYYFSTYFNTYLSSTAGFSRAQAIAVSTISLLFYSAICPLAGLLSDHVGRKLPFVVGLIGLACLGVPIFLLLGTGPAGALIGLLIYTIFESLINVMTGVVLPELFTAQTRVAGGGIGFNIGIGLVGGTGPLVAAALVAATGSHIAPGYYLGAVLLLVGLIMARVLPETARRSLFAVEQPRDNLAPAKQADAPTASFAERLAK